jgi:type VI protein secretion system component Hcp
LKINGICLLCFASILVCGSPSAHAAIGQLTCSSNSGTVFSTNVSYYDVNVVSTAGSQSSGAGAGKVTFNPLVVHIPLANFQTLLPVVTAGTAFSSCTLLSTTAGSHIQYDFHQITITSIDAIAEGPHGDHEQSSAYTKVSLTYGALQVQTSSGTNDGGVDSGH